MSHSTIATPETLPPSLVERLIEAAGRAPSPDNNQPWMFRPCKAAIEVFHRRDRALPSDVRDMFSWIALGAAIENIMLAASGERLAAEVEYLARPFAIEAAGERVATIRFASGGKPNALHAAIKDRVTNRRLYARGAVEPELLGKLAFAAASSHEQVLWLTESRELKALSRMVAAADRIRFEHRPFHEEFHAVLRYGEQEAQRTGDGLDVRTLEVPRIAWPVLRWLRPWDRMRRANRLGASRMFANYSVRQVRSSGAVGLLVTADGSDEGLLEAGRSFERIWLAATARRLAFQPLGSLPVFLAKLETDGGRGLLPEHSERLRGIASDFHELFPAAGGQFPVMLFRVGWSRPPSARSVRLSPGQITACAGNGR